MAIQRSVLVTKAQELMKNEGLDYATAAKKARDLTTQTTPTGGATIPIAPQVTPTVPQPTAPTAQPEAKAGDVVVGVGGEKFIQANNKDLTTTPVANPQAVGQEIPKVTPTPISPVKAKEVPQVDFNVSQGREGETQKNIADITATNPTLLKDRNAYNKAFGYDTADQGKKALLDSAFQSGQPQIPNADMMFSSIVMKAPVPDDQKTTTQYKIAQNRYLKATSYASMTPTQVSSDITSGKLIEGSQTYEDIKSLNPKLIQDTNNLRIVNGSKVSLYSTDSAGNRVNNVEKSFAEDYLGNFGTFLKELFTVQTPEQIRSAIYTDDVKQAQDKATQIELELNQIEADQAKMEKITRKELEGTGASAERIRLEIGIRQDKLTNQYNSKLKEYNTYANKANNLITQNTTVYQEQMKQTTAQQQALAGAAGQVFSQGLSQQNAVFSANLGLQTKQAEFEQGLQQQAYMAKDPISGTNAIIDTFEKMGIMADRSRQEIIADVQAKVASGIPLGQALSELQQAFKSKPMYKSMVDAQMASLQPKPMEYGFSNIGDGRIAITNPKTGQVSFASAGSVSSATAPTGTSAKYLNIPTGTDVGIQCGQFARELCGLDATPGGNSLEARKKAFSDTTPVAGGMVLFSGGTYDKTYGHIASIESVNPDGTMNVVESNLNGDNRVTRRTISASDPNIHGFYNNTPLAKGAGIQVSSEAQAWVNAWNNGTMDIETILTKIGSSKEAMPLKNEVVKAIDAQGGIAWRKETDPAVNSVKKLKDTAASLTSKENLPYLEDVSGGYQFSPWDSLTKKKQTYLSKIQNLIDTNTLQQLIDAKAQGATFGALSNEELKMLQASASSLAAAAVRDDKGNITGFNLTESELKKKLQELETQYSDKITRMTGAGVQSATNVPATTNTGAGQVNYVSPTGKTYSF